MINSFYENEIRMLRDNQQLQYQVDRYLENQFGLQSYLKGFKYLSDIITITLVKKKYSKTTIAEIAPFIAWKYGIKDFSVQRQLRYVCTLKTNGASDVDTIVKKTWTFFKMQENN